MADISVTCDVAIVGSGFAGSLIANELSKQGIRGVILEAGPDVQPNFNAYMDSFYRASSKVPESPYPPAVFGVRSQLPTGEQRGLILANMLGVKLIGRTMEMPTEMLDRVDVNVDGGLGVVAAL